MEQYHLKILDTKVFLLLLFIMTKIVIITLFFVVRLSTSTDRSIAKVDRFRGLQNVQIPGSLKVTSVYIRT